MKLSKILYKDKAITESVVVFPEIEGINLKDLNLIVGKNANGKSTLLSVIYIISEIINGDAGSFRVLNSINYISGSFKNGNQQLEYCLGRKISIEEFRITKEQLKHNDKLKVDRNNNKTKIENVNGKENEIYPPDDKLTIHVRRDKKEYPYFEELINWANNNYFIDFSATKIEDFSSRSEVAKMLKKVSRNEDVSYGYDSIVASYYTQVSDPNKTKIKDAINKIGFNITDISVNEIKGHTYPLGISFWEDEEIGFEAPLLSSGMKRTIYLVIYLEYLIEKQTPSMIVIDDLGEGLDYERSVNLGKYVFERCKNSNIQLIAASNDNFLLDAIDLEYWSILNREGNKISAINMESHPEVFEKFNFTGLSNFSLLSSDFLERELQK